MADSAIEAAMVDLAIEAVMADTEGTVRIEVGERGRGHVNVGEGHDRGHETDGEEEVVRGQGHATVTGGEGGIGHDRGHETEGWLKITLTRYMSSMIPSARPTIPPVVIIFSGDVYLGSFESRDGRTDGNICRAEWIN